MAIRAFTNDDVDDLILRRNDPMVAQYQNWLIPFTRVDAERITGSLVDMEGPENDEWWMAIVEDGSGETVGDLALHLSRNGRTAEVGYTFHSRHWGKGYAVEALTAFIDHLYEDGGVARVFGMIHPDNVASAMVLERCGLTFEGHTRSSYWVGDEVSDDWIYGMTRDDWEVWRSRPTDPPERISLVKIDLDNAWDVYKLRTHKSQERFVATVAESYADALFPEIVDGAQVTPWMRAVVADGDLVGFIMVALSSEHHAEPFMWRLLVDRLHQRRGIGGRALDLLADDLRAMGDSSMLTSWGEGKGSPREFYLKNGFEPTGRLVEGETEGRKRF